MNVTAPLEGQPAFDELLSACLFLILDITAAFTCGRARRIFSIVNTDAFGKRPLRAVCRLLSSVSRGVRGASWSLERAMACHSLTRVSPREAMTRLHWSAGSCITRATSRENSVPHAAHPSALTRNSCWLLTNSGVPTAWTGCTVTMRWSHGTRARHCYVAFPREVRAGYTSRRRGGCFDLPLTPRSCLAMLRFAAIASTLQGCCRGITLVIVLPMREYDDSVLATRSRSKSAVVASFAGGRSLSQVHCATILGRTTSSTCESSSRSQPDVASWVIDTSAFP